MKFNHLNSITESKELSSLTEEQLKELQAALIKLGYDEVDDIDGLYGPKTVLGWKNFKEDTFQSFPTKIGEGSISLLAKKLEELEKSPQEHNFNTKDGTVKAIISECKRFGLSLPTQIAYVLATVEHETAGTFKPLDEYGGRRTRYAPYWGRGFVQLTWKANYAKYSKILGIDMVSSPELAKNPNVALFVLVHGFKTGAFTGKKLTDYVNNAKTDFAGARRVINGTDRAQLIAGLANKWLQKLK